MPAASGPGEEIDRALLPAFCRGTPPSVQEPSRADLAELYEVHTEAVRRHLQHFGAREQDLDDLVQEVFLVMHGKGERLAEVRPLDPWLREVCRRVAAGDRRRAHRRREVAFGEAPERPDEAPATDAALERVEQTERLHRALGLLDERSRDLVALHELGNLPLVEVAVLVEADRKTVRKRLATALRRLTALLGNEPAPRSEGSSGPPSSGKRISEPPTSVSELRMLAAHPMINVGLVGSTVIAIWPRAPTLEALEILDREFARALELSGTWRWSRPAPGRRTCRSGRRS
jgi:RNA polymerase sigma-70 factor, ECF subfamily